MEESEHGRERQAKAQRRFALELPARRRPTPTKSQLSPFEGRLSYLSSTVLPTTVLRNRNAADLTREGERCQQKNVAQALSLAPDISRWLSLPVLHLSLIAHANTI